VQDLAYSRICQQDWQGIQFVFLSSPFAASVGSICIAMWMGLQSSYLKQTYKKEFSEGESMRNNQNSSGKIYFGISTIECGFLYINKQY